MIKILTATYNHCDLLPVLYNSLLGQTNKEFQWIIIDDGSTDETEDIIKDYVKEGLIDICYRKKANGGKSSAINLGLDYVSDSDLVVIVDDDETLMMNAIDVIEVYYKKYFNTSDNVGLINFQRINKSTGNCFANYTQINDLLLSYFDFTNQGYSMDGYIAYLGYAIKQFRFPIFDSEKYIGPSVLIMLCNECYSMVYANAALGESEYMADGITDQGRRLRLKNPVGMIYRCILQQNKRFKLRIRIKYSIAGWAYIRISKFNECELLSKGVEVAKLMSWCKPVGYILATYWDKKRGIS